MVLRKSGASLLAQLCSTLLLPPQTFTAPDILHLYLHRSSFETVLSDEDREQDPDRSSWSERLSRNARPPGAPLLTITIHGLAASFA